MLGLSVDDRSIYKQRRFTCLLLCLCSQPLSVRSLMHQSYTYTQCCLHRRLHRCDGSQDLESNVALLYGEQGAKLLAAESVGDSSEYRAFGINSAFGQDLAE